jgi:hypothetical protein
VIHWSSFEWVYLPNENGHGGGASEGLGICHMALRLAELGLGCEHDLIANLVIRLTTGDCPISVKLDFMFGWEF